MKPLSPMTSHDPRETWRWLPWLMGALALSPLIVLHARFSQLFWFGDEWDLLTEIQRLGYWNWTWRAFAENFVPLFKLAWGGLALASGSYLLMIWTLWLTHALNVALLGKVLRRWGLSDGATFLVLLVFALTPHNLETLGWSVQWSAVLAQTFFFCGLLWLPRAEAACGSHRSQLIWRLGLVLCAAASALSFSRGVLTGCVLAALCLHSPPGPVQRSWKTRLVDAALAFAPAAAVAGLILALQPSGNHQQLGAESTLRSALIYAWWYFGENPFHRLLEMDSWGWRTTLTLTLLKVALIVWVLRRSAGELRVLFVGLLLLDLGNALLLGIGRHHTGLETAHSSRYQYASLASTLPFAAFWCERMLGRVARWLPRPLTWPAGALLVVLLTWGVVRTWVAALDPFAASRGAQPRQVLLHAEAPPEVGAVPGIPHMPTGHARQLIEEFELR